MSFETAAETCVAVSAVKPATHDKAGFAALTWTQIGELETLGDLTEAYQSVNFTNLCTGKTGTKKGAANAIEVPITCARDDADAGQIIMNAAVHAKPDHAFRITEKDADGNDVVTYFMGNVLEGTRAYGNGPNEVKKRRYKVGVTPPQTGDTFVDGT